MAPTDVPERRDKVYAYITHGGRLLVFRHVDAPEAGVQVPGGTLGAGEAPTAGVLREAREETGLPDLALRAFLGTVDHAVPERDEVHRRRFFHLTCEGDPPERWRTVETDPSEGAKCPVFEHFWVTLSDVPALAPGHDAFLGALRERMGC